MSREAHVRFWESPGVRFPRATQLSDVEGEHPRVLPTRLALDGAGFPATVFTTRAYFARSA